MVREERRRGIGGWFAFLLGLVLLVIGIALAAGGAWLILLGGSFYYLPAGLGVGLSGLLLMRRRMAGVSVYLLVFLATVVWALWESGFNLWAQVPRILAPAVLLILVLLCIPALSRTRHRRTLQTLPALVAIALVGGALAYQTEALPGLAQTPPPVGDAPALPPAPDEVPTTAPVVPGAAAAPPPAAGEAATMAMLETGADWPAYGGTIHGGRYSPLDQITLDNVGGLERAWEYRTGDMPSEAAEGQYSPETTPLKVGDTLYLCSAKNILIALDAATGTERWRHDPEVSDEAIPYGATCRGVAYYAVPDAPADEACATRIIEGTLDARLIAVDAVTGELCAEFGTDGAVDLTEGIGETHPGFYSVTSPPTIVRGIAVVGAQVLDNQRRDAPSGVVRGYDAVTGELAWAWDLARPGETGAPAEGEAYTRGTPNMWTTATGDETLGYVYLPLGNSAVDYYGATRSEVENEYATSLVAIDVTTGRDVWHFQTVRYDIWDYDLGSQGTLVDFPQEGGSVPALILPSKQGDIYVLDRRTGEPLTDVEEREVPQGGVEPENLSPTQPFSLYHTLAQPDLEESDMWGMSPLDQLWCRIRFRQASYMGMYTPPTEAESFIQYPGYNGGSDWGGVAIDPERGVIIANYNDMPNHNRLLTREEAEAAGMIPIGEEGGPEGDPMVGVPYGIQINAGWRMPTGLLCKEPPYGGIRAIDLVTGETLWDEPFGTARRNGPFGIPSMLPFDIGTPNNGGSVVTAGGLIFIAAATDDLIRAIDIETGDVVWQDALPAGGQANPMVYEADGRQYLVIMAGGHHFMETPIGDYVIAYALPSGG
jgi:quinoprotein glucose dehydrogenase